MYTLIISPKICFFAKLFWSASQGVDLTSDQVRDPVILGGWIQDDFLPYFID